MRLITWNVARRVEALAAQAAALGERAPDVVALQEVTARTLPLWEAALPVLGLPAVACTLRDADPARAPADRRRTGVLLAARALVPLPGLLPVPWPETALAARVDGVEVHTVHAPNAANGAIKPETLAAVRAGLAARAGPRVLCGDLNTPRREHPDGSVWTFARTRSGVLRADRGERWDVAESALIRGLEPSGFRDAFRERHGHAVKEVSWTWPRGGGYRLDHLIVSGEIEVIECGYLHEWRTERKLSDHSPLVAALRVRALG